MELSELNLATAFADLPSAMSIETLYRIATAAMRNMVAYRSRSSVTPMQSRGRDISASGARPARVRMTRTSRKAARLDLLGDVARDARQVRAHAFARGTHAGVHEVEDDAVQRENE